MGHSIGDGLIVLALAAAFVGFFYVKYAERRRRLELVHQERLAAMDKGIPLPELPIDPPAGERPPDPKATLLHGIVWLALGVGAMATLLVVPMNVQIAGVRPEPLWPFALPLVFLGVGLILFYFLAAGRERR